MPGTDEATVKVKTRFALDGPLKNMTWILRCILIQERQQEVYMKRNANKYTFVTAAMLAAITLAMGFTPLGFIPLPFIKLTIIHIPVILGSILLGPQYGAVLGFLFGLTSLVNNTMTPAVTSFTFSPFIPLPGTAQGTPLALLICFVPRILVGIFPYYAFKGVDKLTKGRDKHVAAFAVGGVVGALTNTVFVMSLIWLFFSDAYAAAKGVAPEAVPGIILGIVSFNGVIEAVAAGILIPALGKALLRYTKVGTVKGGAAVQKV